MIVVRGRTQLGRSGDYLSAAICSMVFITNHERRNCILPLIGKDGTGIERTLISRPISKAISCGRDPRHLKNGFRVCLALAKGQPRRGRSRLPSSAYLQRRVHLTRYTCGSCLPYMYPIDMGTGLHVVSDAHKLPVHQVDGV